MTERSNKTKKVSKPMLDGNSSVNSMKIPETTNILDILKSNFRVPSSVIILWNMAGWKVIVYVVSLKRGI